MPSRTTFGVVLGLAIAVCVPGACASFSEGSDQAATDAGELDAAGPDGSVASTDADAAPNADAAPTDCWALSFDGKDDYVEVPDDPELDPKSPSTIEAWIRYDSEARSEYHVVSHHSHDAKTGYVLMLYGYGTTLLEGGTPELGASGRYYDGSTMWQAGFGANSRVMKGEWAHIAVTYDGSGNIRTHVNGALRVTREQTTNPPNAHDPGPLRIGSSSQGAGGFFYSGLVDEVRISKVARYGTDQFVSQRRWTSDADTIALYHFDEGQGDSVTSENGRHEGKIYGAAWAKIPCVP